MGKRHTCGAQIYMQTTIDIKFFKNVKKDLKTLDIRHEVGGYSFILATNSKKGT